MIHHEVQQQESLHQSAIIKLIGVGGGGCNAVEQMIAADIHGVDFTCVNTDAQALAKYHPDHVIQLGNDLTRGLGAGTDPEKGRLAAEADREILADVIRGTDMLFLTAGMGGGTGTGAIPVIARIARELGVLTVAVVTKPFSFEGGKRHQVARAGIAELRHHVDSLIVVPNENLLTHLGPNISLIDAFSASNDVLTNAVQSIAELITNPGLINVDFADVKSVMTEMGEAMMSTGRGIGDYRARDAAIAATESPLLDEINLKEARGILANITASADLSMGEFQIVGDILNQITAVDANVVIGTVFDERMTDEIRVTVVATGLNTSRTEPRIPHKTKGQKRKSGKSKLLSFGTRKKTTAPETTTAAPASSPADYLAQQKPQPEAEERSRNASLSREHQQSQAVDPVFDDMLDSEPEYAPRQVKQVEPACNACGNTGDAHTENCPQAPKKPFEFSGYQFDRDYSQPGADSSDGNATSQSQNNNRRLPGNEFVTGPKKSSFNKHVAGLAAGSLVLVSIFYVVMTNKLASVKGNDVVDSNVATSTLAERKLKAANKRLSGIDE